MTTQPLMQHQLDALPLLMGDASLFLAYEPGLGKSRTCIEALDRLKIKGPILVVCPAIARENWRNEFAKWGAVPRGVVVGKPDKVSGNVFVTSYDAISLMKPATRDKFLKHQWNAAIFDEAHRLKEKTAKRTKYIYGANCSMQKAIAANAKRVWLLSGTPAPNHVGELWTHLKALNPQAIATIDGTPMRLEQFQDVYCKVRTTSFGRQISGSKNIPHLKSKMAGWFLPKRERDCVNNLPALLWDTYPLPTDNLDQKLLAQLDKELAPYAQSPDPVAALRGAGAHIATERKLLGKLKVPLVAQMIQNELENSGSDHKIIVFAQHKDVIDHLANFLTQYVPVVVDGRTSDKDRNRHIGLFQNDPLVRVFIGQIQATGEAINLTAANRVIFAEPSWTPKDNFQCVKRAHRIGQGSHVRATFAVLANSMDQQILCAVERKTRDLSVVMS